MRRHKILFVVVLLLALVIDTGCLAKVKKSNSKPPSAGKKSVTASPGLNKQADDDSELRMFSSEQARREEADRLFRLAQAYRDRNQLHEAAETMEEVADVAHDNPDAQYHAGMINLEVEGLSSSFWYD